MILAADYYMDEMKDKIAEIPEAAFRRAGKRKSAILADESLLDRLWDAYAEKQTEYRMESNQAFQSAATELLGIQPEEFTEPEINGGYYYCLNWFRSRENHGRWLIKSDKRYTEIVLNQISGRNADNQFLAYLTTKGIIKQKDAMQILDICSVTADYIIDQFRKEGKIFGEEIA